MLESLKFRNKLWGFGSFFKKKEDYLGTAKAIEQYLSSRHVKFVSSLSQELMEYLRAPDQSKEKNISKDAALLMFLKVSKQYSKLLSLIEILQRVEENAKTNSFLPGLQELIQAPCLFDVLLEKDLSLTDLINRDQLPFCGKTIELLLQVSERFKKLKEIEEQMKISESSLLHLIKSIESTKNLPQSIEEKPLLLDPFKNI